MLTRQWSLRERDKYSDGVRLCFDLISGTTLPAAKKDFFFFFKSFLVKTLNLSLNPWRV